MCRKTEIFDCFPPGEAFGCGGEIGLRAEVVFGPYGVGSSAVVVVGADDHIRPWRTDWITGSSMVRRRNRPEGCRLD